MVLNTWWDGDTGQRYWMEVATTGSMGDVLIAPRFLGSSWSYELVSQVRTGDRILHWQSVGDIRGMVGWSAAKAEPEVIPQYRWQPRGTSGRALDGPRTTEGWVVSLGGLNRFGQPLTANAAQQHMDDVLAVRAALEREHGKPIYFPFYQYGGRELRAQQGYLVKFPVELFDVLPAIGAATTGLTARDPQRDGLPEDHEHPKRRVSRQSTTRIQDPQLRLAIENHAVEQAIAHYERLGAVDIVKLGKPYDISLVLNGESRHVEVKGSSLLIEAVELTVNEVTHATDFQPTDLVVVDGIEWLRRDGRIATTGGRLRVWSDWVPTAADLSPRKFAYALPAE